VQPPS